jgi:hypothetical protein
MPEIKPTVGDRINQLTKSLRATNVLSKDYTNEIISYAHLIAEAAYREGKEA